MHGCRGEARYVIVTATPPFAASRNAKAHGYCVAMQMHWGEEKSQPPYHTDSTRAGQLAWLQEELTQWKKAEE